MAREDIRVHLEPTTEYTLVLTIPNPFSGGLPSVTQVRLTREQAVEAMSRLSEGLEVLDRHQ